MLPVHLAKSIGKHVIFNPSVTRCFLVGLCSCIVRIRRRVSGFDFSQQLPDIFRLVYDTNIKLASLGSAQLGLGSLRFILNIMASVERVVILLQGCIFDACGSYHTWSADKIDFILRHDAKVS